MHVYTVQLDGGITSTRIFLVVPDMEDIVSEGEPCIVSG